MQLRLLGVVEVVEEGRVLPLTRTKERAVLAALALRVGEVVSEDRLLEALWGENLPASAPKALQSHISRLRKALGPAGAAIETRPGGYRLAPGVLDLDVTRANELLAQARNADSAEAVVLLSEAAALWRGPSLGELATEAFAHGEAARLEELRTVIAEERVEAELALGHHSAVIAELEALCAAHPLRERLWAARMLALARAGRQAEALRAFQELRTHLGDELGLDPSAELRDLDAAVARQDPSLAWMPPTPPQATPSPALTLPTGVVTFLLTDIEGSTALWDDHPKAMKAAVARHDQIVAAAVEESSGVLVKTKGEGDSAFSVFARASDSLAAALEIQRRFSAEPWSGGLSLRVRAALHTGEAELRDGDYYGPTVNRAARLRAIAHGGQTLLSDATASISRGHLPARVSLEDRGTHRLRDLAQPEHVYELVHPDLARDHAPLRSLDVVPNNLPVALTTFIGRQEEVAQLCELVTRERLVTLTGAAGCGKTRLAMQVAAELTDDYPDGVFVSELGPVAAHDLVLQSVAGSLGIWELSLAPELVGGAEPAPPLLEVLLAYLRPRRLLLVLDNCEHLLRACADLAETLLRACSHLRIVATSREPLGLAGEATWRVPSLSLPPANGGSSVESLKNSEAARLFCDRARLAHASFALSNDHAGAVADICWRLDGIPLALELAAARVKVLSPAEIAARLDDRFRLLTGGPRTALERHRTLRAAVDWSYEALSHAEQALLARLSVFAGGFALEGAEKVCVTERQDDPVLSAAVLDLMSQLVDKSLVTTTASSVHTRYRLLETIRQYAQDKLADSGQGAELRARHRDYYAALARRADSETLGPRGGHWLGVLDAEHDNLLAALEWSLGEPETGDALRLASALGSFWWRRGYLSEGRRYLARALATPGPPSGRRAWATYMGGVLAHLQAESVAARDACTEALEAFRNLGDDGRTAMVLTSLIDIYRALGDLDAAQAAATEAVAYARASGAQGYLLQALAGAAGIARDVGHDETRSALIEEALAVARAVDSRVGMLMVLSINADIEAGRGNLASAVTMHQEAIALARESGDRDLLGNHLAYLAVTSYLLGERDRARACAEESMQIFRDSGSTLWFGAAATLLACDLDLGRLDGARQVAAELRSGHIKAHSWHWRSGLLILARCAAAQGDLERAATLVGAASYAGVIGLRDRQLLDEVEAVTRQGLSTEAFETARDRGQQMSVDEAMNEAVMVGDDAKR